MKKYQNRFFLRGVKEDPSQKGKQKQGIEDFGTYNTLYRLPAANQFNRNSHINETFASITIT
jgi:hypothetical protein